MEIVAVLVAVFFFVFLVGGFVGAFVKGCLMAPVVRDPDPPEAAPCDHLSMRAGTYIMRGQTVFVGEDGRVWPYETRESAHTVSA